jgi:hypothetical protein
VYFRQLLNDETACASYLLGCKTHSQFAVVDPHVDLVDQYIALAEGQGAPIVAVIETATPCWSATPDAPTSTPTESTRSRRWRVRCIGR